MRSEAEHQFIKTSFYSSSLPLPSKCEITPHLSVNLPLGVKREQHPCSLFDFKRSKNAIAVATELL